MSIRMIVLTDAQDGTKVRIAAHSVSQYYRAPHMVHTRLYGGGIHDVLETVEEIDRLFLVTDPAEWAPQDNDQYTDADGVTHT